MPSSVNVSAPEPVGNENRPATCCFCGMSRIWKHGHYIRSGFYWLIDQNPPPEKKVQRYLCQSSACKRTFCALPENILPYCRFFFDDFFLLYSKSTETGSAWSLWKTCHLLAVSLKTIQRLRFLFNKALLLVQSLYRESEVTVSENLKSMSDLLIGKFTWFGFTTRWYHALYPARLWETQNPHNLQP